jgi:hypothetical protein
LPERELALVASGEIHVAAFAAEGNKTIGRRDHARYAQTRVGAEHVRQRHRQPCSR